jgi:hypothetical protein
LHLSEVIVVGVISHQSLDVIALIGPRPPVRITEQLPSLGGWYTLAEGYLLFRGDYPSDEAKKRRKRLLVSNWK